MEPEEQPRYAQSLSFLLSQVGARSAELFAERLVPFGVSPRAYGVLSNLAAGRGRTQQQLADALGIHRNNMVGLIDEMEAAGWVRRHRNEQDRRAFDVRLTRSGSALVARVDKVIPGLDEDIGAHLARDERRVLSGLLARLAADLHLTPGVHPHLRSATRRKPAVGMTGPPRSYFSRDDRGGNPPRS
jgi:DNA-binding MarR family transcriptional regulator